MTLHHHPADPARWYVLATFSFVSCVQYLMWLTYSPVTHEARRYYGLCVTEAECAANSGFGQGTIDMLLNWGPIMFLASLPSFMRYSTRAGSLRPIMRGSATLLLAAALLRYLPTLWWPSGDPRNSKTGIYLVHLAHIFIALVGPPVMATPTKVSAVWFPAHERNTASAVALTANSLGAIVGFFAPNVVQEAAQIPRLLLAHVGAAGLAFVLVFAYFPGHPRYPPSEAAERLPEFANAPPWRTAAAAAAAAAAAPPPSPATARAARAEVPPLAWPDASSEALLLTPSGELPAALLPPPTPLGPTRGDRELRAVMASRPFHLLAVLGGGVQGVFNGWCGSLDSILPFSATQCGWMGLGATAAVVVGGLAAGRFVDGSRWACSHLKALLLLLLAACAATFGVFSASLPMASLPALLPGTAASQTALITLAGLLLGASYPVVFELGVELTYPASESISGGLLAAYNNLGTVALLLLKKDMTPSALNLVMAASVVLCLLCVSCVRERYARPGATPRTPGPSARAARGRRATAPSYHSVAPRT